MAELVATELILETEGNGTSGAYQKAKDGKSVR
jgi:hypothetical protein